MPTENQQKFLDIASYGTGLPGVLYRHREKLFPNRYKEAKQQEAEYGQKVEDLFGTQQGYIDRRGDQMGAYLQAIGDYQNQIGDVRRQGEKRLQQGLNRYLGGAGRFGEQAYQNLRGGLQDAQRFIDQTGQFRQDVSATRQQDLTDAERFLQDASGFRGSLNRLYGDLGTNYLDTAQGSALLNQAKESQRRDLRTAAGSAVRGGASPEARIAGRQAAQSNFANTLRNLSAQGEAYQQNQRAGYLSGLGQYQGMLGQGLGMRGAARGRFLSGQQAANQQLLQGLGMREGARGQYLGALGQQQNMLGQAQGFEQNIAGLGENYASRLANVLQGRGNYQNLLNQQLAAQLAASGGLQDYYAGRSGAFGQQAGNILQSRRDLLNTLIPLAGKAVTTLATGGAGAAIPA